MLQYCDHGGNTINTNQTSAITLRKSHTRRVWQHCVRIIYKPHIAVQMRAAKVKQCICTPYLLVAFKQLLSRRVTHCMNLLLSGRRLHWITFLPAPKTSTKTKKVSMPLRFDHTATAQWLRDMTFKMVIHTLTTAVHSSVCDIKLTTTSRVRPCNCPECHSTSWRW